MSQPLQNSRIGIYECTVVDSCVSKGRYIRGDYIGVFTWESLVSKIVPDIIENNRLKGSRYPILITSWQLGGGDPSKGSLGISRRGFPQPRRKRIPKTEHWEAVIDHSGLATRVEGRRLVVSIQHPEVAAALRDEGADASNFKPIDIKGEPLSTTVLRERR
jgi:hypothetical protein